MSASKVKLISDLESNKNQIPVNAAQIKISNYCGIFLNFQNKGPSGKKIDAKIRETTSKTYCIEFEPVEVGSHLVEVYFNGVMLKNFPFVIKVYDTSKIKVNRPDRAMMDESIKLQSK